MVPVPVYDCKLLYVGSAKLIFTRKSHNEIRIWILLNDSDGRIRDPDPPNGYLGWLMKIFFQ